MSVSAETLITDDPLLTIEKTASPAQEKPEAPVVVAKPVVLDPEITKALEDAEDEKELLTMERNGLLDSLCNAFLAKACNELLGIGTLVNLVNPKTMLLSNPMLAENEALVEVAKDAYDRLKRVHAALSA